MWHGEFLNDVHMEVFLACLGGRPIWGSVGHLGGGN
jgi:hypothetical protein